MICIECGNPDIKCLFSRYKSEYIKLTVCPYCGQIADKYIEYDSVILFLDILLLKKQAYRHLAFNLTEIELLKQSKQRFNGRMVGIFNKYKQLMKVMFVIVLFEVYLMWAKEEKKPDHSMAITAILEQPVLIQYVYFISKSLVEKLIFNIVILSLFRWVCGWGSTNINTNVPKNLQFGYSNTVLIIAVMMANSIKLFPILMLIWPYDQTFISRPWFDVICFVNLIEAIHVVTSYKYTTITFVLAIAILSELCGSKLIHSFVAHYLTDTDYLLLLGEEFNIRILHH
ncbi:uncharacterized protein SPAPADRAFT_56416 [Spathaspora passalidarum NRRL Y-27907]|uniref:Protein ARV n=1 Tax=Spathaspora passalidarum (strain NRRL Y-27907 / 11-Y1) TaxID=619300 RepID=G3AQP8_SPAPN|nr:uncharacterized protein SPAPADRAFT_56416 [Spathaspora passalidarum NRRL Y-27907]EGW31596.1 hypothetical protein SPAPADRAFT_56416 [Spathaspora passalidarum NRRL Y-27907]